LDTPRHSELEQALEVGVGHGRASYRTQKEHWQQWLGGYSSPGAYGRSDASNRSARYVYNHIRCAPMLFWLAEAAGVSDNLLELGFQSALRNRDRSGGTQCAAFRRAISWEMVFTTIMA